MSAFNDLRKKLSDKEFKSMWAAVDKAEREYDNWGKEVVVFLKHGNTPSKSSADIEKSISGAEKIATEVQKLLKKRQKNDGQDNDMKALIKKIQDMQADHRKRLDVFMSRFEALDSSRASEVSGAVNEAKKIVDDIKSTAGEVLGKLKNKAGIARKGALRHTLGKGGRIQSHKDQTEKMSWLMGRSVKSSIDFDELKAVEDSVDDLEKIIKALEQAEKMIGKL